MSRVSMTAQGSTDGRAAAPALLVLSLDDDRALDPGRAGAKAANLARAARHGLPTLPGFVLTTAATGGGTLVDDAIEPLRRAWQALSGENGDTFVVRSSSTVEDTSTSSMAGQFTSVLGVRGWRALLDAVSVVLASAAHPRDAMRTSRPMAVLVQPQLDPVCGGVLFGLDPVTGNRHHVVVEAVPGMPDVLVSGAATAVHLVLGMRGRLVGGVTRRDRALLTAARRRNLARLARRAARAFGGPQDLEWAIDADDRLWLLQSRDVTATAEPPLAAGPILGPGPVAETFPNPLRPLEIALWVEPLRAGVVAALHVVGVVGRRRLDASPVVVAVGGRVAVDLELFGIVPRRRGLRALNPIPAARRLFAAWRVGRLRAALPALTADVLDAVDAHLAAVGDLADFDDVTLADLALRSRDELVALHGQEVLAGMLLRGTGDRASAAALALDALRRGRADGMSDDDLVAREPVVLALVPPSMTSEVTLPVVVAGRPATAVGADDLGCREALRLRCRWVQELGARAVTELADRLVAAGVLDRAELVRELTPEELTVAAVEQVVPTELAARAATPAGAPLPLMFRLTPSSVPVAVVRAAGVPADGLPASAGRATGIVCLEPDDVLPDAQSVLVVETLDPDLASALPTLAALVAETGSVLSHLAILAREMHVPTVVALDGARSRFPAGSHVLVDGGTGEVRVVTTGERS